MDAQSSSDMLWVGLITNFERQLRELAESKEALARELASAKLKSDRADRHIRIIEEQIAQYRRPRVKNTARKSAGGSVHGRSTSKLKRVSQ